MFALGETLHEARARRGLSLADVESQLRIRTYYLAALEEERFDALPGAAYARAFLRGYAEFLELDGDLFLDEYAARFAPDDELEEIEPVPQPLSPLRPRRRLVVVAAAVAVATLASLLVLGLTAGSKGTEDTAPALPTRSTSTEAAAPAAPRTTPAPAPQPALVPVAIRAAGAWDPDGDGHEHDADVPAATDDDPASAWTTETYDAGLQKPGVGLLLDAGGPVALKRLVVVTDTPGYTALVQAGPAATGPFRAVSTPATVSRRTVFTLRSTAERYYVVWITRLANLAHVNEVEGLRETPRP